ncbi:GNAT family N-acetyltransferase [Paracoccus marcusii]|uniref:GNAT family N-acetyltransferase n=1 Tax=Paracoccus marcusii TaxID=59779 RepID=UPI00373603AA
MADYAFRPVTRDDLPVLARWLAQPEVAAWWPGPDRQIALIRDDLGHRVMRQMIVVRDGTALAYVQSYPAHHWPAPNFAGLPADAVALDVFSGPDGVGQGGAWLRTLGDLLLLDCSTLAIDPAPGNQRAIAAYRKAGFAGNDHRLDAQGRPVRVMTRLR